MKRFTLVILLALLSTLGHSQCVISQDAQQRVITTCQTYASPIGLLINRTDRKQSLSQAVFLGSEYFTYPVWQPGSLVFENRALPCQVAYNLMTNQVLCQFEGDSVIRTVTPDAFTINGIQFVSRMNNRSERVYYRVLYAGKIRLLAHYTCSLRRVEKEPYAQEQAFDGMYQQAKRFYIQREDQKLRHVGLSRKSLRDALADPSGPLPDHLNKKKFTPHELVSAVAHYDGMR